VGILSGQTRRWQRPLLERRPATQALNGHQLRQAAGVRHLTNVSSVLSGAVATGCYADEAAYQKRLACVSFVGRQPLSARPGGF
jgi:hypothetical protein